MNRILLFLTVGLLLFSCSDNETTTRLNVLLVDAPAEYDAVNVEILSVAINYGEEGEENGWEELDTQSDIYNLLTLTAGNEALLVSNDIPSGRISQIRLILGENNSVVIDGDDFDLKTPSGQSSGVKLSLNEEFEEGIDYTVILDFDAARSVLENPVRYTLKPVIRANLEATNGAIKGRVDPVEEGTVLYLMSGEETITTTYLDPDGNFFFRGIAEGIYYILIDLPEESIYSDQIIEEVEVNIGEIKELELTTLEEK
jgi:hypothetical protein